MSQWSLWKCVLKCMLIVLNEMNLWFLLISHHHFILVILTWLIYKFYTYIVCTLLLPKSMFIFKIVDWIYWFQCDQWFTVENTYNFLMSQCPLQSLKSGFSPALWWIDDQGHEKKFNFQQISSLSKRWGQLFLW